jgi:PAS domain S-box-containing protein
MEINSSELNRLVDENQKLKDLLHQSLTGQLTEAEQQQVLESLHVQSFPDVHSCHSVPLLLETDDKERLLYAILGVIPLGVMVLHQRRIVFANQQIAEFLNLPLADIITHHIGEFYASGQDHQKLAETFYREIHLNGTASMDVLMKGRDNQIYTVSVIGQFCPIAHYDDSYLIVIQDISPIKKTQDDLIESRECLQKLLDTTIEGIFILRSCDEFVYINQAALNLVGYEYNTLKHLKPSDVIQGSAFATESRRAFDLIDRGMEYNGDATFINKQGQKKVVEVYGTSILLNDQRMYYFSFRDISVRTQANEHLRLAKERAEMADRLKSSFLANLSHEIRTPLNAIVGFSHLLKDFSIPENEKSNFVDIICNGANNLIAIITDIMDLASINSGEMALSKTGFRISDLLEDLYLHCSEKIKSNHEQRIDQIIIDTPALSVEPLIFTDYKRLKQAFCHLIDNAIKFTPHGSIALGYEMDQQQFRFFVRDTGIGIEPNKVEYIFDAFRQGDESTSKSYGGAGLGLTISHKLIHLLGGELMVNSQLNKGTEFYFYLPSHVNASEPKDERIPNWNNVNESNLSSPALKNQHEEQSIIIADLDPAVYLALKEKLLGRYPLLPAGDVEIIETLLRHNEVQVLVVDIQMLESAEQFIFDIKRAKPGLVVIAHSLYGEERDRLISAGYDGFVEKNRSVDKLVRKIDAMACVPQQASSWTL